MKVEMVSILQKIRVLPEAGEGCCRLHGSPAYTGEATLLGNSMSSCVAFM